MHTYNSENTKVSEGLELAKPKEALKGVSSTAQIRHGLWSGISNLGTVVITADCSSAGQ